MNAYSQLLVCDIDVDQFSKWDNSKDLEIALEDQEEKRLKGLVLTSKAGILIYPFKHTKCDEKDGEYFYSVEARWPFEIRNRKNLRDVVPEGEKVQVVYIFDEHDQWYAGWAVILTHSYLCVLDNEF